MKKRTLIWLKRLRVASQAVFLAVFVYTFVRSLDPFSVVQNPFLRFDPLIFLTNPRPDFYLIAANCRAGRADARAWTILLRLGLPHGKPN